MIVELIIGTKKYTMSPLLHKTMNEKSKVQFDYSALEINSVEEYLMSAKERGIRGFNISIPYKTEIIKYLDYVDDFAQKCQSVNTVLIRDGKTYGYSTDGYGFLFSLGDYQDQLKGKLCAILGGNGGAGKVIRQTLINKGARVLSVTRRLTKENEEHSITYNQIPRDVNMIINCTPIGTLNKDERILNLEKFNNLEFVYDCVYNPLETDLLRQAKTIFKGKCRVKNGLDMLFGQALESRKIWGDDFDKESLLFVYRSFLEKAKMLINHPKIYIMGYMGAGKTTFGKELAKVLEYKFLDTDSIIEERYGKISEIFREKGEEYFRKIENEVLTSIDDRGAVISLGGGVVTREENREFLKKCNSVIYLKERGEVLYERVKNDKNRPLVGDEKEFLERLSSRLPLYEEIITEVDGYEIKLSNDINYEVVKFITNLIIKEREQL